MRKEQFEIAKELIAEYIRNNYRNSYPPRYAKEWIKYFDIFKDTIDIVYEANDDKSQEEKIKEIKKRLIATLPKTISDYFCNGIDNLVHVMKYS